MKVLLFALFALTLSNDKGVSLQQARSAFELASSDAVVAADFLSKTTTTKNNIMLGYKGAITMIMAKHTFNPVKKYDCFNDGKALLELAIKNEPNNIELRYLRFSIQCNTPSFLGYHNEKQADKNFLLRGVSRMGDVELKRKITSFLLQSSELSAQEKQTLRHLT